MLRLLSPEHLRKAIFDQAEDHKICPIGMYGRLYERSLSTQ